MNKILTLCFLFIFTTSCHRSNDNNEIVKKLPPEIIILAGQSNMVGVNDITELPEDSYQNINNIFKFNNGILEPAEDPLHGIIEGGRDGVGPGISAANTFYRGRDIILIPCALGGSSIKIWNEQGSLFSKCIEIALDAQLQTNGTFTAILWYQGETDVFWNTPHDEYKLLFVELVNNFRKNIGNIPVIITQLSTIETTNLDFLHKWELFKQFQYDMYLSLIDQQIYFVQAPLDVHDGVHITVSAQIRLGERYGIKLREIIIN